MTAKLNKTAEESQDEGDAKSSYNEWRRLLRRSPLIMGLHDMQYLWTRALDICKYIQAWLYRWPYS